MNIVSRSPNIGKIRNTLYCFILTIFTQYFVMVYRWCFSVLYIVKTCSIIFTRDLRSFKVAVKSPDLHDIMDILWNSICLLFCLRSVNLHFEQILFRGAVFSIYDFDNLFLCNLLCVITLKKHSYYFSVNVGHKKHMCKVFV